MSLNSKGGFYPFLGRNSLLEVLVAILLVLVGVDGARLNSPKDKKIEEQLNRLNNPAVKTITVCCITQDVLTVLFHF